MNTNNNKFTFTLIILVLMLLTTVFIQRCNREEPKVITKTVTVEVPAKSGSFISPNIFIPLVDNNDQIIYKTDTIIQDSRMNRELVDAYIKTKDSLVKERLYKSAITKRKYRNVFENEVQKITIDTEVEGNLLSLIPSYEIKPQTIKTDVSFKEKQPVFAMYVGGGISNNTSLDNFAAEAKVGFQNKKGDIIYGTYDTKGNIGVGYTFRLFQIKK